MKKKRDESESCDYYDYYTASENESSETKEEKTKKVVSSRSHWTTQQDDPKREIREANEAYSQKRLRERKEKDEKELIARWSKNQQLFEGQWKVKPGCIHIPDKDRIRRLNLCTWKYEEPEKVEQIRDKQGRMTTINVCFVGSYVKEKHRKRAASVSDSCDIMTEAIASPVLPVIEEQERSCDFQEERRNVKMNKFLKLYLIVIGAVLLAERPQLDIESINRSLVKTRHAAALQLEPESGTSGDPAGITVEG